MNTAEVNSKHGRASNKITRAAKRFDVDVSESNWRELLKDGKSKAR